jgi:hypothetical protein
MLLGYLLPYTVIVVPCAQFAYALQEHNALQAKVRVSISTIYRCVLVGHVRISRTVQASSVYRIALTLCDIHDCLQQSLDVC